ncbi:MAG: hypothetical protein LBE08_13635 [Bifidobacteriaceae bacterium]|jgi:hypothetical protein|nr:hypothetical protein [Bifidobacteriaceae bacterium]
MVNRALALGEAGAARFRKRGDRYRAEYMVLLYNGERVSVSASGATKREADDKLRQAIGRRLGRVLDPRAITDLTPLYMVAGQLSGAAVPTV